MAASSAVVVAEASDPVQANVWLDALADAGITARSFEQGVGGALGGAATGVFAKYAVVVARDDLVAARNVISHLDGGGVLAPVPDEEAARESQRRGLIIVSLIVVLILALGIASRLAAA
jgi:hypothetical protein